MVGKYIAKIGAITASPRDGARSARETGQDWSASAQGSRALPESAVMLDHALWLIRWVTIVGLLMLSIAQPLIGRIGLPTWALLAIFAGYSGTVGLLHRRVAWLRPYSRIAVVDLIVVAALYTVGASPGGPVFVLFLLITVYASSTTTLLRSFLYTLFVLIVLAIVSPTLPQWSHDLRAVRDLEARLIVVVLVSVGTTLLVRQLNHERSVAVAANLAAGREVERHRLAEMFIASVSHEFRTPLTALQAGLGLLDVSLQDRIREDEQHLLGTVRRNSERLGFLVGDLLTYNQLEMGAEQLDCDRIDLSDVVRSAVCAVEPLLRETGHQIEVQIANHLPVVGDARRLEQLLLNLLANVCAHTPAGVEIRIRGAVTGNEALVTVSDNGPGIPPEELNQIFQPFHRLDRRSGPHGSGLGLAIAQVIAKRHGARLWAESVSYGEQKENPKDASGTTFHLALPLPPDVRDGDSSCH